MSEVESIMSRGRGHQVDDILNTVTEMNMRLPEHEPPGKMCMMNFKTFSEVYGIPVETLRDWKDDEKGFAGNVAFKIGSRWYIDIQAFKKWRAVKHRSSYRYA